MSGIFFLTSRYTSAAEAIALARFSPGAYRGKAVRSGLIRLITFPAK